MWRSLANNLRAAARTMRTLAEMAALPGVVMVVVVVVVATSGEVGLLPSGHDAGSHVICGTQVRVFGERSRGIGTFFLMLLGPWTTIEYACHTVRASLTARSCMHAPPLCDIVWCALLRRGPGSDDRNADAA